MFLRANTWQLGGATYSVNIVHNQETNKWSYTLTETFPNKHPWSRSEDGYASERGAMKAAASAYKKRAKLNNSDAKLIGDMFTKH